MILSSYLVSLALSSLGMMETNDREDRGVDESYHKFIAELASSEPSVAADARRELAAAYPGTRAAILLGLRSSNMTVRIACLRLLSGHPDARNVGYFDHCARFDRAPRVRIVALHALRKASSVRAMDVMRHALERESDPANLRTVLKWVACARDRESVGILLARLRKTTDPSFRSQVIHSLRHITGFQFGHDLGAWEAWWEAHSATRRSTNHEPSERELVR